MPMAVVTGPSGPQSFDSARLPDAANGSRLGAMAADRRGHLANRALDGHIRDTTTLRQSDHRPESPGSVVLRSVERTPPAGDSSAGRGSTATTIDKCDLEESDASLRLGRPQHESLV